MLTPGPNPDSEFVPVDLVIALIMASAVKTRENCAQEDFDFFTDARNLLTNHSPVEIEQTMNKASLVARLALGSLAGLNQKDFFLGACLTSLAVKAFDPEISKGLRVAVAGLIDAQSSQASCPFKVIAQSAFKIATDCNEELMALT